MLTTFKPQSDALTDETNLQKYAYDVHYKVNIMNIIS